MYVNDLNIGIFGGVWKVAKLKALCGKQKFCCGNELFILFFFTLRVKCFVALCRCVSQVPKHSLNQETAHMSCIKTNQ